METKLRLKCGNIIACGELAEFISGFRGVRSSQIIYEVRGGVLEVSIFGSPNEVLTSKRALMKAYEEWRKLAEFRTGKSRELDVKTLSTLVGKPVIPDVLVFALKNLGYPAELRGGTLVTHAPADMVLSLAREVSVKLEEVSRDYPKATRNVKSLLVALSLLGHDIRSSLQSLMQMGFVEENHKLRLNAEWSSLLAKLYTVHLGASENETRAKEGRREGVDN